MTAAMTIARKRQAELKYYTRFYAAALVEGIEAAASGHFDFLNITHEEGEFIEREMHAIGKRIFKEPTP